MKKRIDLYLLLLALIIAIPLRFYNFFDSFGFYGDQGEDLLAVNNWIQTGNPPLVGIKTSIGDFHMGPLYYYLITPFVLISGGPAISPAYLFLIAGIILVAVSYIFFSKFINRETAFIIAILIAASPHIIFLSKGAYSPNLAIVLSVFMLFSFFQYLKSQKYFFIFLTFFWIGVGLQMHYTFLANLLIILLLVLIFSHKSLLNPKFYLFSLAGFIIPLVPFILGQFYLGFEDFTNIYKYLTTDKNNSFSFIALYEKLLFPFEIFYPREYLPWFLQIMAKPFFSLVLVLTIIIANLKNNLTYLARVILVFYFLGALISVLGGLKFWWWYNDFFSIGAIIMIGIVASYLFQYGRVKFVWLLFLSIFILWNFSWLDKIYINERHPDVSKKEAEIIYSDLKLRGLENKSIGIFVLDLVSNGIGFEQRYFLENKGIKTFSTKNLYDADYLILENSVIPRKEITTIPGLVNLRKIGEADFSKENSRVVKSVEVYSVNH